MENLFENKLKIVSKIGKGRYSNVYHCKTLDDKDYALKVIPLGTYGIPCLNEILILRSLKNQFLNSSIYVYSDLSCLYIFSELACSDIFKWRLNKGCIPTNDQIFRILNCILLGLKYLHEFGYLHGDIKSQNILIYNDDMIKLNDFSITISKINNKSTHDLYTSTHRPIEIFVNGYKSEKSDIWSLGCTLFEIKYGYCLFHQQYEHNTRSYISAIIKFVSSFTKTNMKYPTLKYNPPLIPSEFNKNDLIDYLIIEMLQINLDDRASMNYIFDYMNFHYQNVQLMINYHENLQEIVNHEIKCDFFDEYDIDKIVKNLAYSIFLKVNFKFSLNKYTQLTCLFIANKLIYGKAILVQKSQLESIIKLEKEICKYLEYTFI